MASVWPGALDNFALGDPAGNLLGPDVEDLKDAVNKMQAEEGVNPSGAAATLAARLLELQPAAPVNFTITGYTPTYTYVHGTDPLNTLSNLVCTLIMEVLLPAKMVL